MQEPSITASRLAIAAGLAAAIAIGATGFLIGRTTAPRAAPAEPVVVVPEPAPTLVSDRTLRRVDLIDLAEDAADALSSGLSARDPLEAAAGRRLDLVLPFGCSGPDESGAAMRWHYEPANETLRITVEPASWTPEQWGFAAGAAFETAEGFWIGRPWSSSEACPPKGPVLSPDSAASTLPEPSLAIAQFFAGEARRDARRDGRPYEVVKRVPADTFDGSRGFLLRVRGRIAPVPGSGLVHCIQPAGAEQRPLCMIGARIDEVAIESPVSGEVIASWPVEATR